jgi:hypothetical protein
MNLLTPVATVLSVFVAYYFGQKSRTAPLRSATYSKQIDLAHEMSGKIEEWGEEMREEYSTVDANTPVETKEEKSEALHCKARAIVKVGEAMQAIQRCQVFLPDAIMQDLDDVVSVLLSRSMKLSTLFTNLAPVEEQVSSEEMPPDVVEKITAIHNTDVEDLRDEYRKACASFRETCREEFGIEALTNETRKALEQLETIVLPQLRD